jgi:hypothetical protein
LSRRQTAHGLRRENRRQPANPSFPRDHFYLNSSRAVSLRIFTVDLITFAKLGRAFQRGALMQEDNEGEM